MAISVVPRGTDAARIVELIETRSIRGAGTLDDPVREVLQYWTKTGHFIAEANMSDVVAKA